MGEKEICKECFYNRRFERDISCTHEEVEEENRVYVKWNTYERRLETTKKSIRSLPESLADKVKSGYVAMCDGTGNCRGDDCTYAHGRPEQKHWNKILKDSSK